MTDSRGTRGKYAEKKVREYMESLKEKHIGFDFERVSDARSAGGRGAKKVVGDFLFFSPGVHGVLEVKEVNHLFRLPAKNLTQLPKLRIRELAGGRCLIVVYFKPAKLWRVSWAKDMENKTTGSWDMTECTPGPLTQVLPETVFFK